MSHEATWFFSVCCGAIFAFLLVPPPIAFAMSTAATAHRGRVAILGSGVAGSTAARALAEANYSVTVFECGYGVGGRTSTRVKRDDDGRNFAFDHGAQYIGRPKTDAFESALKRWESDGFVREWTGRVAHATSADDGGVVIDKEDERKARYVGYPAMNSICTNLLNHDNINVVLQTRACAAHNDDGRWELTSHGDKRELGQFDWLVGSDRLSATNNRADLRHAPLAQHKKDVEQVVSVPILVLMVALESPLTHIPYDGVTFDEECGAFGSLGWIARDTSKPGRDRADGAECWVVQSGPKSAERIISSIDEPDFEKKRELAREKAKEVLLKDFTSAIRKIAMSDSSDVPRVVSAVGHRWSAAFPTVTEGNQRKGKDCFVDTEHNFVACGDYMGNLLGRVEGAYLSGAAAAAALIDAQVGKER